MVPIKMCEDGGEAVDWKGLSALGRELLDAARLRARSSRGSSLPGAEAPPDLSFVPMLVTDVFDSMTASSAWYDKVHIKPGPGRNIYLSQTQSSNGVQGIVGEQGQKPEPGNCITMTLKTQATFYQPSPFYTAQNFLIFRHASLDADAAMVLVTSLRRAVQKFSWGYGVSMARLRKTRLMVPVTTAPDGTKVVDWEGMRVYGRMLRARADDVVNTATRHLSS